MKIVEFEMFKREFQKADLDDKITMFTMTENLNEYEYGELLKIFPIAKLDALEKAMEESL